MTKHNSIEIKKIDASYSQQLSDLLSKSDPEYSKYFIPFNFDLASVRYNLERVKRDVFFGIFAAKNLVGFHMLRGWDSGYEIPAYGVFIVSQYSGFGLGKLSLQHAISFCRLNHVKKMILKVHPENLKAKKMYEDFGFVLQGVDKKINNLLYNKEL